jgi:hypothetical protein
MKFVNFGGSASIIRPVGKKAVTRSSRFPRGIIR